jgi:ATP-dependent RNA helicase SUPV3L1/SUV3
MADPRLAVPRAVQQLIYRSAWSREKLRESINEPSVEISLRHLEDFITMRNFTPAELARTQGMSGCEKVEMFVGLFREWYLGVKAPAKVQMGEPWDWFPKARQMRRKFIFHAGPTNSGKTHQALETLMKAKSGVYCAPLKALASQVWKKVDQHVPCDLLIGDERRFGGAAEHVSCTMEMCPVDFAVDVGVIDEIQMIEDPQRGWAWTRAVLGLPAREVHLCGETRSLEAIKKILYKTFELKSLSVVDHRRLVPLKQCASLGGDLNRVENGDCIVCFSRKAVFEIRQRLLALRNVKVNIVYGGLPFEVREAETDAYNTGVVSADLSVRHVLVTTDAIAYGLNMNIRRIIFATMRKFDGHGMVDLSHTTTLQVAGRAGRFGLHFAKEGFATTLYDRDWVKLETAFKNPLPQISRAGVLPSADVLELWIALQEKKGNKMDFPSALAAFVAQTKAEGFFQPCDIARSLLFIGQALKDVPLVLKDRITFCYVPMGDGDSRSIEILKQYAQSHANGDSVPLVVDTLFHSFSEQRSSTDLEWLYRLCEVYCWLSWRFPKTFLHREQGADFKLRISRRLKELVCET